MRETLERKEGAETRKEKERGREFYARSGWGKLSEESDK